MVSDPTVAPTRLIDSDHPAVVAFAHEHGVGDTDREIAVSLYYAVRDGFRYDPYRIDLSESGMAASTVLADGYGWCVTKASLLAAAAQMGQRLPAGAVRWVKQEQLHLTLRFLGDTAVSQLPAVQNQLTCGYLFP